MYSLILIIISLTIQTKVQPFQPLIMLLQTIGKLKPLQEELCQKDRFGHLKSKCNILLIPKALSNRLKISEQPN